MSQDDLWEHPDPAPESWRAERDRLRAERDAIIDLCISPEYGAGGRRVVVGYRGWGDPQLYAVKTRDEGIAAIRKAAGLEPREDTDARD